MSSFIVKDETLNKVISFIYVKVMGDHYFPLNVFIESPYNFENTQKMKDLKAYLKKLMQDMHNLNVQAYKTRHKTNTSPEKMTFSVNSTIGVYQALKSLDCWLYQCSEGEIPKTPLYKAMTDFRNKICHHIITRTQEYDKEMWG